MAAILKEIETQALQLTPQERSELIHRLIVSLEGSVEDTPEAIAQAWDDEIARRVADMEAGRTQWIPADETMSRIRAKISAAKSAHAGASPTRRWPISKRAQPS
ncbi:MAG: addiction module protein [Thiobacillaceae bacterium]